MKIKLLTIFLAGSLFLSGFVKPAIACYCPDCYSPQDGGCVYDCRGNNCCDYKNCKHCEWYGGRYQCRPYCSSSDCKVCDGNGHCKLCGDDPNKVCCNGQCIDISIRRTQKCCWDEITHVHYVCDVNKTCCSNGNCCDPKKCEDCNAFTRACEVCDGDPSKKCCNDGSCAVPCQIVDGEDCAKTSDSPCDYTNCALEPGLPCYSDPARTVYEGGTEKKCSPRGCVGDCHDDTKVCYRVYECIGSSSYEWMSTCSSFYCLIGWGCWYKGYYSCEDAVPIPVKCYGCEQGPEDINARHYVDNDSCGG